MRNFRIPARNLQIEARFRPGFGFCTRYMKPETRSENTEAAPPRQMNGAAVIKAYFLLVIALVATVCLSLALVLAYGSKDLSSGILWFIALFLVVFALFGTATVVWLLTRYSAKLAIADGDGSMEWKVTPPEKQKRRLNDEVRELCKILDFGADHQADLRAAYIVAEDLAMRRIQNECGSPLMRKVSIGNADFDAVLIDKDVVICIAVTFLVRPEIPREKINRFLREAAAAKNALSDIREGSRVRLLLLLVTQLDRSEESRLRASITEHFKSTPVDVDIRWMDFQGLQKLYSE